MPGSSTDAVQASRPVRNRRVTSAKGSLHRSIDFPVIGIGASAGGLEACTKLLDALADVRGMAFILVQHLDPTHESRLADLLAGHTSLKVLQAADGMPVERNHLYIIPPASFLAIREGALRLKPTQASRGARLPFDVLLQSMAQEGGVHAVCVVLSGTGADGSAGLQAIKQNGGFVIAQEPGEAGYDGMPLSAIATGAVDVVLPLVEMPEAIIHRRRKTGLRSETSREAPGMDRLPEIVELLRTRTTHDFSLYKHGTLKRQVERRMAMPAIGTNDMDTHVAALKHDPARVPSRTAGAVPPSRQAVLAEFCRRHALDTHAPATVLSNRQHECLYSLGPTERYLRMAPGHATLDVLAMLGEDLRTWVRSAILRSIQDKTPVIVSGGRTIHDGRSLAFNIEVHPVENDGEELLLIYFVDQPEPVPSRAASSSDRPRRAELERELRTNQVELQGTVRSLEISGDERKTITENALSANEEFQSAEEELLTSKQKLRSLNKELTVLNSQLQETLEQQRTTSNDLQNVLYSTDVATLFLDRELKIRFFTPATEALFHVVKTDVGRPLEDLRSLAADGALPVDVRTVLKSLAPIEREIETAQGVWCCRVLPYRTHDDAVEGVVVTFTDITQRRHAAQALETAKRDAELANAAKSRFLVATSHDLRQPLQTLSLLQGLLANRAEGTTSEKLVARLDETVGAMSGMLDTLLDINQIEAGLVRAEIISFGIDDVLARLRQAFAYDAQAHGVGFRVVPCPLTVESDPRLLEQMLRNLVSNAIKYTPIGKVLLGCRRSGGMLRIEVWDTGIGVPASELDEIFHEYHQLDNAAREPGRGPGSGLSIVRRLGALLDHRVRARSRPGTGSVFSIEVPVSSGDRSGLPPIPERAVVERGRAGATGSEPRRTGRVLIVEDDPEVRELLTLILSDDGHPTEAVRDGPAALVLAASVRPDLILADYNLPNGMDGLVVAARLRAAWGPELPVIILTGDISTGALSAIAAERCLQLNKPVKPADLTDAVKSLLSPRARVASPRPVQVDMPASGLDPHVIFVVDDDRNIRDVVRSVLENGGHVVQDFMSGEAFLRAYRPGSDGCLLIDAYLPGIGGLELLQYLRAAGDFLPAIMITGSSDVPMAVEAMKAGAADFIEKPIAAADLLASIARALERSRDSSKQIAWQDTAAKHIGDLTPRQHQIMDLVLAGHPSKNIAADLGISQRTVENHRASIMKTTGTKSLPALARLALAAAVSTDCKARHGGTSDPVRLPSLAAE